MGKVHRTRRLCSQKGFTLIELMAVLAILAIILAIAVPSIGKILDKAEESADESAIDLIEHAGELADVDKEPHDTVVAPPGGDEFAVPEKDSYSVPTLVKKGYLKLDKDSKFYAPGEYVTKKNKGGEYVYKGKAGTGSDDGDDTGVIPGLPIVVDSIKSCEDALDAGYDKCLETVQDVIDMDSGLGLRYIAMNDIDFESVSNWVGLGAGDGFSGELNGNGYRFSNVTMSYPGTDNVGFFSMLNGATVQNVWFDNIQVEGANSVGGLTAYATNMSYYDVNDEQVIEDLVIDNVVVDGSIQASGGNVGMLTGSLYDQDVAIVSNVFTDGTISAAGDSVGGMIGEGYFTINDASSAVDVVSTGASIGGLLGEGGISGGSKLEASGDVRSMGDNVGGLVGTIMSGPITDAVATGAVYSEGKNAGGLVGFDTGARITGSHATGTVYAANGQSGGLVGFHTGGLMSDVYATGAVSSDGDYVGGLVGLSVASGHKDLYATGDVTSSGSFVGGLIGENNGPIENAYATGNVRSEGFVDGYYGGYTSEGSLAGGLIGYNTVPLSGEIYATGNVEARGDFVGGLVGSMVSNIAPNAYATGDVTTDGGIVGGVFGYYSGGQMTGVYATGDISSGGDNTGGLAGKYYGGDISQSYYVGSIKSTGNNVGGLIGESVATISDSYAVADITAPGSAVGGVVGYVLYGDVTNVYASGSVAGDSLFGNTAAHEPTVTNSYWNNELSAVSGFGEGRSASQLKEQSTFAGWDFDSIWTIESGQMPELR